MTKQDDMSQRPVVEPGDTTGPADQPPEPTLSTDGGVQATPPVMSKTRETVATIVAVIVLILVAYLYAYMLGQVDGEDLQWARRMQILTGVEAIVFAAAGFLFGSQVQRQAQGARVDAAEDKAAEARRQARREEMQARREREIAEQAQESRRVVETRAHSLAASVLTATESQASATESLGKGASLSIDRNRTMQDLALEVLGRK